VDKTGRVVLVDQATRHASVSSIIAAEIVEQRFSALRAPIIQVTAADTNIPYSEPLEAHVLPDVERIVAAVRKLAH
jgi:pyruvate dehydrogenase E1 component beta subunit